MIGKFAYRQQGRPGAHVLDIGCGKGGDLNKWKQARIRLYVALGELASRVADRHKMADGRYRGDVDRAGE